MKCSCPGARVVLLLDLSRSVCQDKMGGLVEAFGKIAHEVASGRVHGNTGILGAVGVLRLHGVELGYCGLTNYSFWEWARRIVRDRCGGLVRGLLTTPLGVWIVRAVESCPGAERYVVVTDGLWRPEPDSVEEASRLGGEARGLLGGASLFLVVAGEPDEYTRAFADAAGAVVEYNPEYSLLFRLCLRNAVYRGSCYE